MPFNIKGAIIESKLHQTKAIGQYMDFEQVFDSTKSLMDTNICVPEV